MTANRIDVDLMSQLPDFQLDPNISPLMKKLSDAVNKAIIDETFRPEAWDDLPLPWLAKKCGVSVSEADDLSLKSSALVMYQFQMGIL